VAVAPVKPARPRRRTPVEVTPEVIRVAITELGGASAKEIAEVISAALDRTVSGRAIRFMAERVGATVTVVDGERRYSLAE
jgi:hypothetical protein